MTKTPRLQRNRERGEREREREGERGREREREREMEVERIKKEGREGEVNNVWAAQYTVDIYTNSNVRAKLTLGRFCKLKNKKKKKCEINVAWQKWDGSIYRVLRFIIDD